MFEMLAAIIPCYRVKEKILGVIEKIDDTVDVIIVVDDACPENSGLFVEQTIQNEKVQVIFHTKNKGVGGATMSGYVKALELGCKILVKIDGDGQMDPSKIPTLIEPI